MYLDCYLCRQAETWRQAEQLPAWLPELRKTVEALAAAQADVARLSHCIEKELHSELKSW